MTWEDAVRVAREQQQRLQQAYVVYRLPAWPAGHYGVIAFARELPAEATVLERLAGPGVAVGDQGSLF